MRRVITGEQVAQIYNPDPFARPVFRAPVYQTPAGLILLAWLARLLYRLARLAFRHPVTTVTLALLAFLWFTITWIGLIAIVACANLILATWRWFWPSGFARWVSAPARNTRRARVYRRRWPAVMTIADLAPLYRGRIILPVLVKVTSTRYVDRVAVRLVSGQCAADFAARADILAHGFGAMLCRVRSARSGAVVLEFVRRDALATVIPALPIPALADLKALPVGRREDGLPWLVRLHGTCANWLRYGIQPKNARPGLVPGRCKGKAHHPDHLGYAGRRVLVSRKWSGKTLADHRADRQQWLLETLGVSATDPARYRWELVSPGDPDYMDHARRLLHAVADRARWLAALKEARQRANLPGSDAPAGKEAA